MEKEETKNVDSEKEKQKKWKKNAIIAIILFLLLVLVRLFIEFGWERQRMFDLREQALEAQRLAALQNQGCEETRRRLQDMITIFCEEAPQNCEEFRNFANIDDLSRFADSLRASREQEMSDSLLKLQAATLEDSLRQAALLEAQIAADERRFLDSAQAAAKKKAREREIADNLQKLIEALCKEDPANCENFRQFTNIDDLTRFADSLRRAREEEKAALTAQNCRDLSPLWVYPEPSGGLHFEPIRVSFSMSRPANVYYKRSREADFRRWGGEDILISQNTDLFFRAVDECGNVFTEQKIVYAFGERQVQRFCPPNMALIQSADPQFCIDQYMWPNERGVLPMNLVSHLQARDLCASVGKRLCTAEEWTAACNGPYNWRFPYGNNYLSWACITQDTTFRRSGEASACRSWYAVFDMSGNLSEWTNTRAPQNNRFFKVMGGFWESGQSSNCSNFRFSYHPQNRHNPVGFRCCKDLSESD
ncbi:MAG: SUMF1/EgtB/PvdO family nonheme iron enzyme [Chitinivibrionia bacterium]|nr:SUMF1/EgtB/PvdO family nonheme iron enzyme [Chitinivibrionia bacterium]